MSGMFHSYGDKMSGHYCCVALPRARLLWRVSEGPVTTAGPRSALRDSALRKTAGAIQ